MVTGSVIVGLLLDLAQKSFPVTGEVVRSIPEVIRAASTSPLGILALLIIVGGGITYVFLKGPARRRDRLFVIVLVILGIAAYATAMGGTQPTPPSNFSARVLDADTKAPIAEAKVTLQIEGPAPYTMTDSEGVFSFWLRLSGSAFDARLRVEHEGYQPYDRTFPTQGTLRLQDVVLKRTVLAPEEPRKSDKSAATPLNGGSATGEPAVKVLSTSSGSRVSGAGPGWSEWYELTVGPVPTGYALQEVEFWLTGDRQCNAWAACQEVSREDGDVIYRFRLQGHSEWVPPGQAFSEGHLRATYARTRASRLQEPGSDRPDAQETEPHPLIIDARPQDRSLFVLHGPSIHGSDIRIDGQRPQNFEKGRSGTHVTISAGEHTVTVFGHEDCGATRIASGALPVILPC